jgi:hypothetical protein
MESERIEVRMSTDMVGRIDQARGLVPRGTWIKAALEQALAREGGQVTGPLRIDAQKLAETVTGSMGAKLPVRRKETVRKHAATCKCPVCKP